jgi:glycosyltransferase involved in cell wall biosynthesis
MTDTQNAQPAKRTCILVLGMHRSGTSAVTRVLSLLGASLPKNILGAGPGNETGHWEPTRLVQYHEQLLAELGSAWHDWSPLDFAGLTPGRRQHIKHDIAAIIQDEYLDADLIVVKDPRICRFAEFFAETLDDRQIETTAIIALRNPLDVINSLMARKALWPQDHGRLDAALLWLAHMMESERAARALPHAILSYEVLLGNPVEAIKTALNYANLATHFSAGDKISSDNTSGDKTPEVEAFVDSRHRHHAQNPQDLGIDPVTAGWVAEAYGALKDLEHQTNVEAARSILDRVHSEFQAAMPVLKAAAGQRKAAFAARRLAIDEADRLRGDVEAAQTALEAERAALEKATKDQALALEAEAALQRKLEKTNKQFAATKQQSAVALASAQDEAERLRAEIAAAQTACDEATREIESLRGVLEQTEKARQTEIAEVERLHKFSLNKHRIEIANLHGELKEINSDFEQALNKTRNIYETSTSWKITQPLRSLKLLIASENLSTLIKKKIIVLSIKLYNYFFPFIKQRSQIHKIILNFSPQLFFNIQNLYRLYSRELNTNIINDYKNNNNETKVLFSVVIPIYDRTEILREAIESILNQTFQDFELILVSDGSPADTIEVMKHYANNTKVRAFYYPTSSGNAVRGRNKGILEARGDYISFLDSDDIASPRRLEITQRVIEQTNCDVVYGAWQVKLDGTREIEGLADGQVIISPQCQPEDLYEICVPCQSTVTVRRRCFENYGYLKPNMEYREDHELWARLAYNGASFVATPEILTNLRIHKGNNELNFKNNDTHWKNLFNMEYKNKGPNILKIVFVVAGLGISGGLLVIIRHAESLMRLGHDVYILNKGPKSKLSDWIGNTSLKIIDLDEKSSVRLFDKIDIAVATFWTTLETVLLMNAHRKIYFVQSDERLFYDNTSEKQEVEKTYRAKIEFIVIAKWIQEFLEKDFFQKSILVENGIDFEIFNTKYRDMQYFKRERKVVLIEGPLNIPWKGVEDAYNAVCDLPVDIWLVTPDLAPPVSWNISRHICAASQNQMAKIYNDCDIFLKLSRVESFCLPALEAMACGCATVVGDVNGGIEYLIDKYNCLRVPKHDINAARDAVCKILSNQKLFETIIYGGKDTAMKYNIIYSLDKMKKVIESESFKPINISEVL